MGDQEASRLASHLRVDAYDRGRSVAAEFAIPAVEVDSEAEPVMDTVWRAGFAAGWAARDMRDDEPETGVMVWLRDEEGDEYVARRCLERGDPAGNGLEAVWEVSGRPELMAWADLMSETVEWGRLTKEGR